MLFKNLLFIVSYCFKADALIALPGGYGTIEELLEMITW